MIKLNLGCGAVRPEGWINTDSSINARLQKFPLIGKAMAKFFKRPQYHSKNFQYMNLNKQWTFNSNSVDIVYASHLFEHLSSKSASLFLKESYRVLKPGGCIRIVVPDLYKICKAYINEYEEGNTDDPTQYIMWAINMHRENQYKNLNWAKKIIFGIQDYPHQHKYMYDEKSLLYKLKNTGFQDILSFEYGISNYIKEINDVEGTKESYKSIYLEAIKK